MGWQGCRESSLGRTSFARIHDRIDELTGTRVDRNVLLQVGDEVKLIHGDWRGGETAVGTFIETLAALPLGARFPVAAAAGESYVFDASAIKISVYAGTANGHVAHSRIVQTARVNFHALRVDIVHDAARSDRERKRATAKTRNACETSRAIRADRGKPL